ncbi:MAG: hypothetical protein KJ077_45135 [Anaerolineae bacterium]|nr:hypothetical protein [Anaerolineae bacterium]
MRQIENFPSPIRRATVHYKLSYCNFCAWNNVELQAFVPKTLRPLSNGELEQIHNAVMERLQQELNAYAELQGKLSSMPFGMATSVIGAALGNDAAELSVARQMDKGISLDVAYGELCQALAQDPYAETVFRALAEEPGGHVALLESVKYWHDKGLIPPWKELVEPFLRGSDPPGDRAPRLPLGDEAL